MIKNEPLICMFFEEDFEATFDSNFLLKMWLAQFVGDLGKAKFFPERWLSFNYLK